MAKRTDTNVAVLIQVVADLGFDDETIGKVTGVPPRTINDIANRRGYWAYTGEFNELRESVTGFICESSSYTTPWPLATCLEAIRGVDCGGRHNDCGDHLQCPHAVNVTDGTTGDQHQWKIKKSISATASLCTTWQYRAARLSAPGQGHAEYGVGSVHRFPANQIFGWLELQRVKKIIREKQ